MSNRSNVWFVTGTSSGFGRTLVEEAIARGERVVATARKPEAIADLVALAPERVLALALDVTQPAQIERAVAAAIEHFGAIDVLVNNAGFSIVGALEETSEQHLRDTMETMFFGAVATTRAVLPQMRTQKSGTIVQITSVGGVVTAPGFGPYCAAKHALEAASEALAAEVAPHGIRVAIIEPGAFRTELFAAGFRTMPATPEYQTSVGPTRQYVLNSAGKQAGDPRKAAKAILDTVAAGSKTLRLPLGADAVASIRQKLAQIAADVTATEAIANSTDF